MSVVPRMRILAVVVLTAVLAGACASRSTSGPVPRPFPGAEIPPAAAPPPVAAAPAPAAPAVPEAVTPDRPADSLSSLIATALGFRGIPYRYGGSDPASGFDCSGFVQYVYARVGLALPREVRDQYEVGKDVRLTEVEPGDLIFFETVSRGPSHVGMAIGGEQFVHAPSSRGVVRVEKFSSSYWASRFVGARRVSR